MSFYRIGIKWNIRSGDWPNILHKILFFLLVCVVLNLLLTASHFMPHKGFVPKIISDFLIWVVPWHVVTDKHFSFSFLTKRIEHLILSQTGSSRPIIIWWIEFIFVSFLNFDCDKTFLMLLWHSFKVLFLVSWVAYRQSLTLADNNWVVHRAVKWLCI